MNWEQQELDLGDIVMPVREVIQNGKKGYQFGHHGKVYTGPGAEAKAKAQEAAAFASGYKGSNPPKGK